MVHASRGRLRAGVAALRREVAIVCRLARGDAAAPTPRRLGRRSRPTTTRIRDHIARVVPGFDDYNARVARARRLRAAARRRATRGAFPTATGKANFTVEPARRAAGARRAGCCCRRCAATTSTTPRSTASTTATAASTAAAGWCSSTPTTSPTLGLADGEVRRPGQRVARRRRAPGAAASASSPTRPPRGCARGVLPRDQRAGAARLGRGDLQHPDLQEHRGPAQPGQPPGGG